MWRTMFRAGVKCRCRSKTVAAVASGMG